MFFLTLEEQNRVTAQAKRKFSLLSHTPANRNECPCCKHFLTTPANTSILSLTLKNQNFEFVTLTRAPSQPVALLLLYSCYCPCPGRSVLPEECFQHAMKTSPKLGGIPNDPAYNQITEWLDYSIYIYIYIFSSSLMPLNGNDLFRLVSIYKTPSVCFSFDSRLRDILPESLDFTITKSVCFNNRTSNDSFKWFIYPFSSDSSIILLLTLG